jgi:PST family polysaccharide transporter
MSGRADPPSDLSALRTSIVRGGAALFAAQFIRFFIQLGSQVLVARLLTPADYGLVAMVYPVLSLVQLVSSLGLGQTTVIQAEIDQRDVSSLFWFGLVLNAALCGVLIATSPLIGLLYHDPRVVAVEIALALLIPIAGLGTQPAALLSRHLRLQSLAVIDILPAALGFGVAYWAASHGFRYWSLVLSAASETMLAVVSVWVLSKWLPTGPKYNRRMWSLVRIGGNLTIYNLSLYVTTSADNILLGVIRGPFALGLYDKSYKLVTQSIGQLGSPATRIAIPLLSRLRSDDVAYRRAFLGILGATMMVTTPGILWVMIDSGPLTGVALGRQWSSIWPVVSWLCVGGLVSILYTSVSWLFVSQNRTQEQLRVGLAVAIISVVSFVVGLPWGAAGVAAGAALAFLCVSTPITCWTAARSGPAFHT